MDSTVPSGSGPSVTAVLYYVTNVTVTLERIKNNVTVSQHWKKGNREL